MTRIDPAALREALEYRWQAPSSRAPDMSLIFAAARAYLDGEGWQPIETAPKGEVLRFEPAVERPGRPDATLPARVIVSSGMYPRKATHWMPLPTPPEST